MLKIKRLAMTLLLLIFVGNTGFADTMGKAITIPSSGLSMVRQAGLIGPVNSNQKIQFTVWLKLRNKAELDQLVQDIYDPNSKKYQQFLTSDQIQARYAPDSDAINAVQRYFVSRGMDVNVDNQSVHVTATAQQIEQVFQVKMNNYSFRKRTVYSNATAPILSADVAQYVSEVSGLNNMPLFHPMIVKQPSGLTPRSKQEPKDLNFDWNSFIPAAQPTTTSIHTGFTGAQLRTTYNVAAVQPVQSTVIDGAGQTIVIIDGCDTHSAATIRSDGNAYNTANNLPQFTASNFTVINPNGTPFTTCTTPQGWNAEISLDVQSSHTIAPGANTVLVLADQDLEAAVNAVITTLITNNPTKTIGGFPNAYVVSNSWAATESSNAFPSMENNLQLAAAAGISFNFSSGDCGDDTNLDGACANGPYPAATDTPDVNYPASSLYVTAIGGTSLFVDNNYHYAFEAGWGTHIGVNPNITGGAGGGISQVYGPALWQSSISGFSAGGYTGTIGSHTTCGLSGTEICRAVPDVGFLADWYTGLAIYITGQDPNPQVYGGTSLACPLFSGTLALINQARMVLNNNQVNPIGHAAPYLYTRNNALLVNQAINLVVPPHQIFGGAVPAPLGAPLSAFTVDALTFSWNSSLTIEPENQFWNDVVGVGTPNVPNFVAQMATF